MVVVEEIHNPVFSSSTYIIANTNDNKCWIVDPGDIQLLTDKLSGRMVVGIFITHSHFDHIYGLQNLVNLYPQCVVYASEYGSTALKSSKLNYSAYHDSPMTYDGSVTVLKEGDSVELYEGIRLNVIETPGHCPSCLTYLVGNYIFTGDSYIPWTKVVTKLRYGNRQQAQESIERIKSLIKPESVVCPGHWGKGEMILR